MPSDRRCGTCRYRDALVWKNMRGEEMARCNYPVPIWLSAGWTAPPNAGDDCQTWEARDADAE